mmetsp:Transcript_15110/g.46202  ORF Transcript_15110/g.46202 Transcript_15110/m.46202 type:complete len:220 (+) Transcript_15110:563-1222(+)
MFASSARPSTRQKRRSANATPGFAISDFRSSAASSSDSGVPSLAYAWLRRTTPTGLRRSKWKASDPVARRVAATTCASVARALPSSSWASALPPASAPLARATGLGYTPVVRDHRRARSAMEYACGMCLMRWLPRRRARRRALAPPSPMPAVARATANALATDVRFFLWSGGAGGLLGSAAVVIAEIGGGFCPCRSRSLLRPAQRLPSCGAKTSDQRAP